MVPADIFLHILFLGSENVKLEYLVTVVTGNLEGAGTNASVSLVIKGANYVALRNLRRHSITSYEPQCSLNKTLSWDLATIESYRGVHVLFF